MNKDIEKINFIIFLIKKNITNIFFIFIFVMLSISLYINNNKMSQSVTFVFSEVDSFTMSDYFLYNTILQSSLNEIFESYQEIDYDDKTYNEFSLDSETFIKTYYEILSKRNLSYHFNELGLSSFYNENIISYKLNHEKTENEFKIILNLKLKKNPLILENFKKLNKKIINQVKENIIKSHDLNLKFIKTSVKSKVDKINKLLMVFKDIENYDAYTRELNKNKIILENSSLSKDLDNAFINTPVILNDKDFFVVQTNFDEVVFKNLRNNDYIFLGSFFIFFFLSFLYIFCNYIWLVIIKKSY